MTIFVVVPAYNEAKRIRIPDWERITAIDNVQIVFVNDFSTDATQEILSQIPHATTVSTPRNLGKAGAVKFGMEFTIRELLQSTDDWIGFLDADSAFGIEDIGRICQLTQVPKFDQFAGIWASRVKMLGRNIERNEIRHYISRLIITYLSYGMREFPYDSQAGFKLFRSQYLTSTIESLQIKTRWFVDLELWLHIKKNVGDSFKIWEEPVFYWREVEESRIRVRNFLAIAKEVYSIKKLLTLSVITPDKGMKRG